jgi:hypothetical protein
MTSDILKEFRNIIDTQNKHHYLYTVDNNKIVELGLSRKYDRRANQIIISYNFGLVDIKQISSYNLLKNSFEYDYYKDTIMNLII